jgi:hypothetical protein
MLATAQQNKLTSSSNRKLQTQKLQTTTNSTADKQTTPAKQTETAANSKQNCKQLRALCTSTQKQLQYNCYTPSNTLNPDLH